MASRCIASCVDDARAPARLSYVNLHKWAESDAEFVKSVVNGGGGPRVVDSYSCRQMYLRSYTFSREETVPEKTTRCFRRVKQRVAPTTPARKKKKQRGKEKRCSLRKMKEASRSALLSVFNRLLSCTATIDVAER